MKEKAYIDFTNVSLFYDLNYEGSTSLKERMINSIYRRKFPVSRPETLYALNNINIKINQGERVGIIGLNGSGKSTFLKVASGILKAQKGVVSVSGNVQPLIEIGAGFNPEFSGRDNIYLNGTMLGFTPDQIKSREQEIIDFAELNDFIDIPVKYYSSGMSVRLAFTIATMIEPEVLLMDEMLSAGDLSFIEKAKSRIEKILSKAKILVLVSHDLNLVSTLTNRCIVMEKGKILFDGETEAAIKFYKDATVVRLEKYRADEEAQYQGEDKRKSDEPEEQSWISDLTIETEGNVSEISPDSPISFNSTFTLREKFEKLFVNMVIYNRLGVDCTHFRNDFVGYHFQECAAGPYSFQIKVPNFPLKSDVYFAYFRIVGEKESERLIADTKPFQFVVNGNKERDSLIPNQWIFSGPFQIGSKAT